LLTAVVCLFRNGNNSFVWILEVFIHILYGECWLSCDLMWPHMSLYDTMWRVMKLYDTIWPHMILYGTMWPHMTLYDTMWPHMTLYDTMWLHMTLYDIVGLYVIKLFFDKSYVAQQFTSSNNSDSPFSTFPTVCCTYLSLFYSTKKK